MTKYSIGLAFLLLLGACHNSEAPAPVSPPSLQSTPSSLGLADLAAQLTTVACTQMFSCCTPAAREARLGVPVRDAAACHTLLIGRYTAYVQQLAASAGAGRLEYHGDRALRCLTTIAAQACGDWALQQVVGPAQGSDCDTWTVATVPPGGTCADDNECTTNYCAGRTLDDDGKLTDGKCATLPALGASCEVRCAVGSYCDTTSDNPKCVPALKIGEACEDDDQCQSLVCEHTGGSTSGTCLDAPKLCTGR